MSIIIGLYDDLTTAQQAISDLEQHNFRKSDLHLATYDSRASRQGSGGFFDSLNQLFGSKPKDIGDQNDKMVRQLTTWGVPQEDSQNYVEAMRRGSTLILVNSPDDRAPEARQIMDRYNPQDIDERARQWEQQGWQGYDAKAAPFTQDEINRERTQSTADQYAANQYTTDQNVEGETHIPEVEEELRVGKRAVQRGGVRVYSKTTEQPVEETQTLRDERVNVERRDADRAATDADMERAFQDQNFEVTETDEELITDKQARVTGEVVVNKQVEEHPETVRDTVRRTEVHTEDLGTRGQSQTFDTYEPDFRNHYQTTYADSGYDFNQVQPAYRYGYDLAGTGRYQGKSWNEVEPQARADWQRQHPETDWNNVRDAVRYSWESAGSNAP